VQMRHSPEREPKLRLLVNGCKKQFVAAYKEPFKMYERHALTECDEGTLHKSKTPDRALRSNALFVLLLVLVLEPI
jgi:hypothetical protein